MQFVIQPHSFVDVITNSSSELFICDTKKSVDTVKEIVENIAKLYNERIKYADKAHYCSAVCIEGLWTSVFRKPEVCQYTFDLLDFPDYAEWASAVETRLRDYYGGPMPDPHPVLLTAQEKMKQWESVHPAPAWVSYDTPEYKKYQKVLAKWQKSHDVVEEKVYAEWGKLYLDLYRRVYTWAAKLNGIDLTPLGELRTNYHRYPHAYFENIVGDEYDKTKDWPAVKFIRTIDQAIDWEYSIKKGSILLHSAKDNSVPYDFWPDIESTFNCERRHLG